MSYTTSVRFLDPIDPRAVWSATATIIDAPSGYTWSTTSADQWLKDIYQHVPTWFAEPEQGAGALAMMHYGNEGSLIDDRDYDDPELHPNQIPPRAYVEIRLTNGNRYRHEEYARNLAAWAHGQGVAVAIDDEYGDGWAGSLTRYQDEA